VFTFLGEIGGIAQIVLLVSGYIVSIYAETSFYATMIEKLYHVKKYANHAFDLSRMAGIREQQAKKEYQKKGLKKLEQPTILEGVFHGSVEKIPTDLMRGIWNNVEEKRYIELSKQIQSNGKMEKKHIDTLLSSLVTRQNFYYSRRHMLNFYLNCLCVRKRHEKMSNRFRMRPHYLFKRGTKKLDHELDIVGIAKSHEKNRVLKNIIMNKG